MGYNTALSACTQAVSCTQHKMETVWDNNNTRDTCLDTPHSSCSEFGFQILKYSFCLHWGLVNVDGQELRLQVSNVGYRFGWVSREWACFVNKILYVSHRAELAGKDEDASLKQHAGIELEQVPHIYCHNQLCQVPLVNTHAQWMSNISFPKLHLLWRISDKNNLHSHSREWKGDFWGLERWSMEPDQNE